MKNCEVLNMHERFSDYDAKRQEFGLLGYAFDYG